MHTTRRSVTVDATPPYPPHITCSQRWRHHDYLELGALPTAPGSARGHVGNVLREWRLFAFVDDIQMVVSELLTNSVAATRAIDWAESPPVVRLWVLADPVSVLVAAWDAVPGLLRSRQAGQDDDSGRGLAIVAALSAQWDCYPCAAPHGGKVTWALVDTRESGSTERSSHG
jgi:anti-sigma regulatory factor (Ser/Thr protein kinase)